MVQNPVLTNTLPPILPHMNIGQISSGPILQSFSQDLAHHDTVKLESGWDPTRFCMSDLTLPAEKSHSVSSSTNNFFLS